MKNLLSIKAVIATFSLGIIAMTGTADATIIVAENFGGTGADLHGTSADTFDGGITPSVGTAGDWVASTVFKDDGTLVGGNNDGAYLNLGSYIDSAEGTTTGSFTLSATVGVTSGGAFAGFGFFESSTPDINVNFTDPLAAGSATFIYRENGDIDGFAIRSTNNIDNGDGAETGSQLLTIVLDLTPAGGYDGSSNFGTATFYQGDEATGTSLGSFTYTSNQSFGSVGLTSAGSSVDSTFSGFQLSQIPEPSSALLVFSGLGLLTLLRRRR